MPWAFFSPIVFFKFWTSRFQISMRRAVTLKAPYFVVGSRAARRKMEEVDFFGLTSRDRDSDLESIGG
jgi:hypothetical protein